MWNVGAMTTVRSNIAYRQWVQKNVANFQNFIEFSWPLYKSFVCRNLHQYNMKPGGIYKMSCIALQRKCGYSHRIIFELLRN
jgi:hypothetical protein